MSIINREPARKPIRRMPTDPKPVLEVSQVPVFRVHFTKLEAYIQKVFGFEFDFLMAAGISEGPCVEFDVGVTIPTGAWERRANELREGRRTKATALILAVLCHDGYIKAGKYMIGTNPLPDATKLYTQLLTKFANPDAPECRIFRDKFKGDKTFIERAVILDAKVREYMKAK